MGARAYAFLKGTVSAVKNTVERSAATSMCDMSVSGAVGELFDAVETSSLDDDRRACAERWAATHFDDTFVDFGDGDWTLLANDGHVLDWGPR
jgi:hypothetical protein